ncbi:MAG: bifunctional diaminohydroxyphosphoribosylaminopyrimidine deaminase/5-amino-6-(5-phosphoribosylamino)uracil reductase RibD [Sphingobacteriales bacterium]
MMSRHLPIVNFLYLLFTNDESSLTIHERYITRCIELAKLGAGNVAPNPMVGALLAYDEKIIGDGYHQQYGGPHAEVNAIEMCTFNGLSNLLNKSTLYVSLEPCAHFGKTPPCADLIIKHKIPTVVIGCRDPFEEVNGKGIEKLKAADVDVELGILEEECKELNKRFFTFHTRHRPYIILKWAQTADEFIANADYSRVFITNEYTNRLVHNWRAEESAILIGTNTALFDNPELTTRLTEGKNPIRLVVDMDLKLPSSLKIFNKEATTIVFNGIKNEDYGDLLYRRINKNENIVQQISRILYDLKVQSVIIEGGRKLLQSFIDANLWDEARVITNEDLKINTGIRAPVLFNASKYQSDHILSNTINSYRSP